MSEAVTVPSVTMMTTTVFEELLVRDTQTHRQTYGQTDRQTHTHTHTHTHIHTHTHTHTHKTQNHI